MDAEPLPNLTTDQIPSERGTSAGPLVTRTFCRSLAQKLGLLFILLAGWYVGKEALEMMEFRAWIKEVQSIPLASPVPLAGPQETFALKMMSVANGRLHKLLDNGLPSSPEPISFKSSSEQLHDPSGACASFSHVLAKCLLTEGIEVRKVGLMRGQVKAVHHVIEAKLDGRWALMDAVFNQVFRAPDGHLVDAREVGQNWAFYSQQVSADYNRSYDYSGFYHTNWDRIPLVGWVVKRIPGLEAELERRNVSVRFWFFNINRWLAGASFLVGAVLWWWGRRAVASQVESFPDLHAPAS